MDNGHDSSRAHTRDDIVAALGRGIVFVDESGQVLWMDAAARRRMNGHRQLALPDRNNGHAIDCSLRTVEIAGHSGQTTLCVLQESRHKAPAQDLIGAIEAVMADTSRTFVEKIKAWLQATRPAARPSDLDQLTDREREILGLICQGRSDTDMSRILGLSQNTVRNHVASLYRKIGVNRRSAAIIWARERAITSEALVARRRRGTRQDSELRDSY